MKEYKLIKRTENKDRIRNEWRVFQQIQNMEEKKKENKGQTGMKTGSFSRYASMTGVKSAKLIMTYRHNDMA